MSQPAPSPYRLLQRRAKAAGLPANKSAKELAHLLAGEEDASAAAPATATSAGTVSDGGVDPVCRLWPDGLAGVSSQGIFNAIPSWVDGSKSPGTTSQVDQLGLQKTLKTIGTLKHMYMSPNLVWLAMAISLYYLAPYNFEAAKEGLSMSWILPRFALNFAVAFVYYGFFYVGLYHLKLSRRKFLEGSYPTFGNMLHNMWYWTLGIVQWTFWEAVMVRLWATGVVPYKTAEEILADKHLLALNVLWVIIIPVWRDIHFYIAHRFLHIRSIYTYVHKLHHRNADPEPFSGITMHPIEHLYYYSNAFTPSLYLSSLSPLIFTWNFIHLTIAPGAGHSGWEDHFQADQYHYLHHAKFECNYGSPMSGCVDQALGTFREKIGTSEAYTGEWQATNDDNREPASAPAVKQAAKVWSPHGYLGMPASWDHGVYTLYWVVLFPLAWFAMTDAAYVKTLLPAQALAVASLSVIAATLVTIVPVPLGMLVSKLSGDRMSWRWPFQKDSIVGVFGVFVLLACAACIVPVYHATLWSVQLAETVA